MLLQTANGVVLRHWWSRKVLVLGSQYVLEEIKNWPSDIPRGNETLRFILVLRLLFVIEALY